MQVHKKGIDFSLLGVSLVILIAVVFSGGTYYLTRGKIEESSGKYVLAAQSTSDQPQKGLQLYTFTPTPGNSAQSPSSETATSVSPTGVKYANPECYTIESVLPPEISKAYSGCCPNIDAVSDPLLKFEMAQQSLICDSKPVIYLYPTEKTTVSVKLDLPGYVSESIPQYPAGGWQNITAYPGGKLIYQGKEYSELYYESVLNKDAANVPTQGIVAMPENYRQTLTYFGTHLGLNNKERSEFVAYWMGRLSAVTSPYIFFSYYPEADKQKIDGVNITPKPDTSIEFIMYFKPLQTKEKVVAPVFAPIPARQGFTEVEWGGVLDN